MNRNLKEYVNSRIKQDRITLHEKIIREYKNQFDENDNPHMVKYNEILLYDDFYLTCEELDNGIIFKLDGVIVKNYTELTDKLKELELKKPVFYIPKRVD